MGREKHEGDLKVTGEQVTVTKSTHITGSVEIKGNVLVTGELWIEGPLIVTGKVIIAKGSEVEIKGMVVHNGDLENLKENED